MRSRTAFNRRPGWSDKIEGLSFISTDRYDTGPAARAAAGVGLELPDIELAIKKNVDFLVAQDFGASVVVLSIASTASCSL